jgi:hypothetical protein
VSGQAVTCIAVNDFLIGYLVGWLLGIGAWAVWRLSRR